MSKTRNCELGPERASVLFEVAAINVVLFAEVTLEALLGKRASQITDADRARACGLVEDNMYYAISGAVVDAWKKTEGQADRPGRDKDLRITLDSSTFRAASK